MRRFSNALDRLVEVMWPFTITIGVIMAVGVIAFVAFAFALIYGAFLGHFPEWIIGLRKPV